jgi:Ni,Fe-hydrogenase III large subunit/Ni,Fe-hydrogenase III component G
MAGDILSLVQEVCLERYKRYRRPGREHFFLIPDRKDLLSLVERCAAAHYYLFDLAASDERNQEKNAFCLYYVFSVDAGEQHELVTFCHPLARGETVFPSIRRMYAAAGLLEIEIHDLFGLEPDPPLLPAERNLFLHRNAFPPDLDPLRNERTEAELAALGAQDLLKPEYLNDLLAGHVVMVGPIHAKIIGGALFIFKMKDSEIVESVVAVFGFQHRGIEKILQERYALTDGWRLAELVAGDASFAGSLAYCRAVERLARVRVPEVATYWRGLLLEVERIVAHTFDCANALQGISGVLHGNRLERLHNDLCRTLESLPLAGPGSRDFLLRGLNRVGGVELHRTPGDLDRLETDIAEITREFLRVGLGAMNQRTIQKRFQKTGILSAQDAREVGATGLTARSAGLYDHDFRLWHDDDGLYCDLQDELRLSPDAKPRRPFDVALYEESFRGDAMAAFALRIAEVERSAAMVAHFAQRVRHCGRDAPTLEPQTADLIAAAPVGSFGIGHAEGWRGETGCLVWKGADNGIARVHFRDSSVYNWPALQRAVSRRWVLYGNEWIEHFILLADFPIVNKRFNNSYPGVSK